ncbi:nuclear transport factor 2 family protein [Cellulomonas sp. URHD0024]|uniref:nuclear transport factor 2 family protein n=1 Tax=Cellulomonas sp. URHD0024 TaxID=1302620 RepID=UPI000411DAA8|nr:nuclear transport factor 2 family protein [Cellulomonas sp. URHD0024]
MRTAQKALETSLAYFTAWSGGDMDAALRHVSPDVVVIAPPGRFEGADELRRFMEPFSRTVITSAVVSGFGDDDTALLYYDTSTEVVASAPAAERHTVVDGLITELRIVFDRLPFEQARAARV